MRNRPSRKFSILPGQKLLKDTSTPLGKYIIYSVVFCSILAAFLSELFSRLVDSEELAIVLTAGIVLTLLSVLMLKMKRIAGIIERKRMERFNRRLEKAVSDKD